MNPKLLSFLGLAMRAGQLVTGEEQVITSMRKKQVKLVILAQDASPNTAKKVTDKAKTYQVPVLTLASREHLGRAIGKGERVVIGVLDTGFANQIKRLAES